MSQQEVTINTLEELVSYTMQERGSSRYELDNNTSWKFVDEKAGEAWSNKYYKAELGSKEKEKLAKQKPKTVQVETWSLRRNSGTYHSYYINLSPELGKMLDKIWTRKAPYRGANYDVRKGYISLPGILKRLGNTDVSAKIKEAEKKEKAEDEKRNRNYDRKRIRAAAAQLAELLRAAERFELVKGDAFVTSADLQNLIELKDEE